MVPRAQPVFKVGIYFPTCHTAQVQCGRADPSNVADLRQQAGQPLRLAAAILSHVRKAGCNQRLPQCSTRRCLLLRRFHAQSNGRGLIGNVLQAPRRPARMRHVGNLACHVHHHSGYWLTVHHCGDAHGIGRNPVEEVHCSIDRIDDP